MIDLYTYRTSNGRKASIMLEECGLEYALLHIVDITAGESRTKPAFRAINPNGRIPAIIDWDGAAGVPEWRTARTVRIRGNPAVSRR